ncbi:PKD domain-containing protein [Myxococcota bacterium]|nr:PKD domain-containing protein [Myxococcota bacterium]
MPSALMFVALLTACAPVTPSAPLADAGAIVVGSPGEVFMLDGSSTTGEALTFEWTIVDGPATATLIDEDTMTPYLLPEVEGVYTLSLAVCDHLGRCDGAETYALVGGAAQRRGAPSFGAVRFGGRPWGKNAAPVAEASASRSLGGAATVKLNGGDSYDPDGDTLRYRWTFTARPAGSTLTDADIQDSTSALASFTADVSGTYAVRLVVRDGMLSDSVTLPGLLVSVVNDNDPWD